MQKQPITVSEVFSKALFFTPYSREELESRKDLREHYFFRLLREAIPVVETWSTSSGVLPSISKGDRSTLCWVNSEELSSVKGIPATAPLIIDYSAESAEPGTLVGKLRHLLNYPTRRRIFAQAQSILVSRERDAARISRRKIRALVTLIPPLIDAEKYTPQLGSSDLLTLLLITDGQTPTDARRSLQWFSREIEPRLKRPLKDIRIIPCASAEACEPLYSANTVACFPHRRPTLKNQALLQAMACAQAIVTTAYGATSLTLSPSHDALIGDDANRFASSLLKALSDRELRMRLGQNARKAVESRHHWSLARPLIKHLLFSLKHSSHRVRI